MSGYTGHRNIILDEDIPYALGFGLFANYERSSISMRVSAHLCRISDDKSRVGGESKEIYLHDSVAASGSENSQMKLAEIEHLLSLYALAPAYED